jgi:subtilisin family serine protease
MATSHTDLPTPLKGWNTVPVMSGSTLLGFPQAGQASFTDYADRYGHGTRVAGILAAQTDNGIGVAGLAYEAPLLVCRIFNASTGGYSSSIDRCIDLCLAEGAKVFSLSLGSNMSQSEPDAFTKAMYKKIKDAGALVVAASGNGGRRLDQDSIVERSTWQLPAALAHPDFGFDNVIAVAATMKDGAGSVKLWTNSDYAPSFVQLSAPGDDIWTTAAGSAQYATGSGTSYATPLVSGAAAMVWAAAQAAGRSVTYLQVKQALLGSVDVYASLATKVTT